MPQINIKEYDNTTGISSTVPGFTDIPYIPGFTSYTQAPSTPVLCSTITDFQNNFGMYPVCFSEAVDFIPAGVDRSYIMAYELLKSGMPVLYHAVNAKAGPINELAKFKVTFGDDNNNFELPAKNLSIKQACTLLVTPVVDGDSKTTTYSLSMTVNTLKATNYTITAKINDEVPDSSSHPIDQVLTDNTVIQTSVKGAATITFTFSEPVDGSLLEDLVVSISMLQNNAGDSGSSPTASTLFKNTVQAFLDDEYGIQDRSEYSVKYITSGPYANTGDATCGIDVSTAAGVRGDAIGLVEYGVTEDSDVFIAYNELKGSNDSYSAAFAYAGVYNVTPHSKMINYGTDVEVAPSPDEVVLPGAYGYLITLANMIKSTPNYLAVAGTARGLVPNLVHLVPDEILTGAKADKFTRHNNDESGACVNPIAKLNPQGYCIWGNRTLKKVNKSNGSSGTHFLNIRNMLSDIKKLAYTAARKRLFEQNSDTLWLDFKSDMIPLLEQLKSGNAISDYKILKTSSNINGVRYGREEFGCKIQVTPMYAVEVFNIEIELVNGDVAVNGD